MEEAEAKLRDELVRIKAYYPFRIVWGAINPETLETVTDASATRKQVNAYMRKGWNGYAL